MPIIENVNGVMKTHTVEFENVGGVIREKSSVVVNDGGVLRQIHSSGTAIGNLNVGDIVKIGENGTPASYIIVHKGLPSDIYDESCNGVWLLRKEAAFLAYYRYGFNYNIADMFNYINTSTLRAFSEDVRNLVKEIKIPYRTTPYTDTVIGGSYPERVYGGSDGMTTKGFILSEAEIRCYASDGSGLDYFKNGGSKICNYSNFSYEWWTRSPTPRI